MRAPPEKPNGPVPRHADQGQIRNFFVATAHTYLPPPRQYPGAKISVAAVPAGLRDDPMLPIRARLAGLRATYRLQLGGTLPSDTEHDLRRLHHQRRRQLPAIARRYGARS